MWQVMLMLMAVHKVVSMIADLMRRLLQMVLLVVLSRVDTALMCQVCLAALIVMIAT